MWLTRKSDNTVSKLTFSKACHPADSIGVFLEHADGTVEKILGPEPRTSYAYQADMCNAVLKELGEKGKAEIPSKYFTIDYSIYLLEIIGKLKSL